MLLLTCRLQEFSSDFVVLQSASGSFFGPMSVIVERSFVSNGFAGAVFDNDGGLLRINDLVVTGVTTSALVATANNGASFLQRSAISCRFLAGLPFVISVYTKLIKFLITYEQHRI